MRALRDGNRDEMVVHVVTRAAPERHAALRAAAEERLKERLGVRISVELAGPGELDALDRAAHRAQAEAIPRRAEEELAWARSTTGATRSRPSTARSGTPRSASRGSSVRVRRDPEDSFAEPAAFLARMDELGFDTVLLPSAEIPHDAGRFAYERYATPPEQVAKLVAAHPGPVRGLVDDRPC